MTTSNDEDPKEITVKLFAISKELIGKSESLLLPNGITIGMLRAKILEIHPSLNSLNNQFVLAVNHKIVTEDTIINACDEVALLPPVSGGQNSIVITEDPIHVDKVMEDVKDSAAGACNQSS